MNQTNYSHDKVLSDGTFVFRTMLLVYSLTPYFIFVIIFAKYICSRTRKSTHDITNTKDIFEL